MKNLKCFLIFLLLFSTAVQAQREVRSYNSAWNFTLAKEPGETRKVNLPHTWNDEDPFRDGKEYFRGKGTYTKTMFAPAEWEARQVFLKFEGSNQVTSVYVNDIPVGQHIGGYTGFVFDLTEALRIGQENQIRIEVDNSHNIDIPPLDADFNFYGGIYRDLWLITTPKVHFETTGEAAGNFLIRTPKVSAESAQMEVEAQVVNSSTGRKNIIIQANILDPDNRVVHTLKKKVRLKPNEKKKVIFQHRLEDPQLWSPQHPNLYQVELKLLQKEELLDYLSSNFGFRWFEADPEKGFFLNGEPIKLVGANRHQDFEGLGNALPNELHRRDYGMIKEMGANFIRTAHYPQDPEVYRICDELGLLVWSEVPVINDVTDSRAYHETSLQMQREQILQFYNHPSVVLWGHMNEIFIRLVFNNQITEEEKIAKIKTSVELAEKLERETKKLDSTRLTVMALHENELYNTSGIAEIPDVISWNLYFGWYSPGLESFGEFLDKQHQKYPDRPLFISEYGPGADDRIQTTDPKPWDYSEAYQLKLHRSYLNQVLERDFVFGMAAWNFADFGSSFRQDAMPYINQKGLVNFDRSKKDIYYYYQARLLEEPMIYIAGKNFEERYLSMGEKVEIKVFSNAPEVSIRIKDGNFTAKTDEGIASFLVALPEGINKVTATAGDISHSREFKVFFRENLLSRLGNENLLINVGTHVQYRDPVTEEIWISDQEFSRGSFGYVGGGVYQKDRNKYQGTASDIHGTENDPLFQTMREGIEAYKFDVEKGNYRVTLFFAEPEFNASEENIYNLTNAEEEVQEGIRSFDVLINGRIVYKDLNPARDFGRIRAGEVTFYSTTPGGITVELKPNSGSTILSGIKLEKMN